MKFRILKDLDQGTELILGVGDSYVGHFDFELGFNFLFISCAYVNAFAFYVINYDVFHDEDTLGLVLDFEKFTQF